MKAFCVFCACLFLSYTVLAGTISLTADTSPPDPNEEITVWVHTDTPLFSMELGVYVTGDATITTAMSEADCSDFGWDNGWNSDPAIDPNGWVRIGSVRWAADANDIVGYLKFRYHSGQVAVYIVQDYSSAASWDGSIVTPVAFSTEALLFGEMVLPEPAEPNEPAAVLVQCPPAEEGPPRGEQEGYGLFSELPDGFGISLEELDLDPNSIIEIDSDITTNQVWTPDNVYYIGETVNVQALLVIEPGTLVIFGSGCAMAVNNGGTLISRGTPDQPIIYTCDFVYFEYPENIGYYWQVMPSYGPSYYCPVYVQETASPATTITYSFIEGAVIGIVTENIRLDNPIENNYLFGNVYGIGEAGPKLTDIRNNLCFFNDQTGIDVLLGDIYGVSDANSIVTIEQNTCDGGDWTYRGIVVHGVADANDAPTVLLLNNIVAGSWWYGLIMVDNMWALVANTGYFDNHWANKNNPDIVEYNPVEVYKLPFTYGELFYQTHYLVQDCNFINAGAYYIEQTPLIGMTTDANSVPDCNVIDIGFHYLNWDYTNTGGGFADTDFDENGITDVNDLLVVTDQWLDSVTPGSEGDLDTDGEINLADFAVFAANWQKIQGIPELALAFDKEPNNVGGVLTVNAELTSSNISEAWLLMDGQKVAGLDAMDEGLSEAIIKTNQHRNGVHEFKLICIYDGQITASSPTECTFNNELSSVTQPKGFTPGRDYYLYAISDTNDVNYSVELYDNVNDETTFSTECQNGLAVCIPYTAFAEEYGIYDLNITRQQGGDMMLLSEGTSSWVDDWVNYVITRKFDPSDVRHNQYIKMVISIGDEKLQSVKEKCWKSAIRAAVTKGIYPVVLKYEDCTWENLKFCLQLNNVKMWYHLAHGNYDLIGQPPRQCIMTASGKVFSYLKKDYAPNPVPPSYEELSWWYENNPSIAELGFQGTSKMTWVQFNACYSARTIEFPYMLGIIGDSDPVGNQLFVGWSDSAKVYDFLEHYNQFEEDYWGELALGHTLQWAVEESLPAGAGANILENFKYYGVIDWQFAHFRYPNIN